MVETQMVKGSVTPLTVSAQYLSATTIVKPVVVVSSAHAHAPTWAHSVCHTHTAKVNTKSIPDACSRNLRVTVEITRI